MAMDRDLARRGTLHVSESSDHDVGHDRCPEITAQIASHAWLKHGPNGTPSRPELEADSPPQQPQEAH